VVRRVPPKDQPIGSPARFALIRCSRHPNRLAFVAQASPSSRVLALPGIQIHSVRRCLSRPVLAGFSGRATAIEKIRPGDVVWFAPGEKHWHGATPTPAKTHTAIQEA